MKGVFYSDGFTPCGCHLLLKQTTFCDDAACIHLFYSCRAFEYQLSLRVILLIYPGPLPSSIAGAIEFGLKQTK